MENTTGARLLEDLIAAIFLVVVASSSSDASAEAVKSPPSHCDTAGHRQFDFWVGEWDVYRADTDRLVAHSTIERLYAGCAVRENWSPFKGTPGGSLNVYRPASREWRQVWTDADNELHEYRGRWDGRKLVFKGNAADSASVARPVRMTFEPLPDGSVAQTGYAWDRKKGAWALEYKFIYRAAGAGSAKSGL
jgi:hypothetical protein